AVLRHYFCKLTLPRGVVHRPTTQTPPIEAVRKSTIGWTRSVPPSRRPLRGLLRMRNFLNAIKGTPHAEERPKGASRSTYGRNAAFFRGINQFPDTSIGGKYAGNRAVRGDPLGAIHAPPQTRSGLRGADYQDPRRGDPRSVGRQCPKLVLHRR